MSKKISNHIIEIRYKPDSRMLDKRGEIAQGLLSATFEHWDITNNRIDLSNSKNPNITAFFSFRNLGVASSYPNKISDFLKTAQAFIKSAWNFFPNNTITRIGVRSAFLIETKDFKKAFDGYRNKFLKLSDNDIKEFGGDLIDFAFPLNFMDGENNFNVMTGPMEKGQSIGLFKGEKDIFDSGIYVEIDYFRTEFSPHMIVKRAIELLNQGTKKAEELADLISEWINNED